MHSAPSVSYPVGQTRGLRLILSTLCAASLGGICVWCYQKYSSSGLLAGAAAAPASLPLLGLWQQAGPQVLGCLAWLGACGIAWQSWRTTPSGRIRWDGSHWYWEQPESDVAGHMQVVLDAQSQLLMHWQAQEVFPEALQTRSATKPNAASRSRTHLWLWAERSTCPADWLALRRAVYSRSASTPDAYA